MRVSHLVNLLPNEPLGEFSIHRLEIDVELSTFPLYSEMDRYKEKMISDITILPMSYI
jgi:hypothetical protein